MRRLLAALLIVFPLLLAACGGRGATSDNGGQPGVTGGNSYISCPSNTSTSAVAPESGTVTLTVSGWSSSPAEDALVQQNLQNFHQSHPNIQIDWAPIPGSYPDKMRANAVSGNLPDVFYLQPAMAPAYISSGKLLNLSPYMAKDKVQPTQYYKSLLDPFSCKQGQVYSLPKDWSTLAVFYNKQMFQAAGVPFPTNFWTWDEMRQDAKKLTKTGNAATSVYGITLPTLSSRWLAFLFAAGGTVLNSDGTQATFNGKAGVDSLNFYASFQKEGSSVLPADVAAGWAGDAFGKKRAAMALEGGWLIPYLQQQFPDLQYGLAPVPTGPGGKRADLIFTNAWSASASTRHPAAAWELIKYMTGPNVGAMVLHSGFALPTLTSLANDPYFSSHPGAKVMFDAATYGYADCYGAHDGFIHDKLDQAVEKVLLGKTDAQAALSAAVNQVNAELQT